MDPENTYRAAAIVFTDRKRKRFFLGEEEKHGWRHFGGKREPTDAGPLQTAQRECCEETDAQIALRGKADVFYFKPSKQVLFVHKASPKLARRLSALKPTDVKTKYRWFTDSDFDALPVFMRDQLTYIQNPENVQETIMIDRI